MIIWITGASSGLGRELAKQYARAGHKVCVSARGLEALNELAEECPADTVRSYALDVTDGDAANSTYLKIVADVGRPDICVLNAGTHIADTVRSFDRDVFERVMRINYHGTVNCLAAIVPDYVSGQTGHIVVVSSVAGYRGLPHASAYGASKAALINLCESMQPELKAAGVCLSLVNPGFVRTPLTDRNQFDMPFLMEVEDAARQMRAGIESRRFEITFPKRFTWILKFLRVLPIAVYLFLTRRLLREKHR